MVMPVKCKSLIMYIFTTLEFPTHNSNFPNSYTVYFEINIIFASIGIVTRSTDFGIEILYIYILKLINNSQRKFKRN